MLYFKKTLLFTFIIPMSFYQCQDSTTDTSIPEEITTKKSEWIDDSKIHEVAEVMPLFPGCQDEAFISRKSCAQNKMLTYIYKNVKYPAQARKNEKEGQVVVKFIVEKDGQINEAGIARSAGSSELDNEALRIVESMPLWSPGIQDGKVVRVKFKLPIKFKLE